MSKEVKLQTTPSIAKIQVAVDNKEELFKFKQTSLKAKSKSWKNFPITTHISGAKRNYM